MVTLTLLCPGALSTPVQPQRVAAQTPWLNRNLRRLVPLDPVVAAGSAADNSTQHDAAASLRETPEESWLRQRFCVPDALRLGAFAARRLAGPEQALRVVRPVNLHVGLDHLVLSAPSELGLSAQESTELMHSANNWMAQEGIQFRALSTDLWETLIAIEQATPFDQIDAAGSRIATGRNIDAWMVRGTGARRWRRVCNEVQMLWHTHPVNLSREARGAPVVNGLWLEGAFGPLPQADLDVLLSTEPAWQGLGLAAGLNERQIVCAGFGELAGLLKQIDQGRRVLAISEGWHHALLVGNADQWLDEWSRLDRLLTEACRRLGCRTIELICTGQRSAWQLTLSTQAGWIPMLRASLLNCLEQAS